MFQSSLFVNFLSLSQLMTFLALCLLFGMFFIVKILEKKKVDFSIRMMAGLFLGVFLGILLQLMAGFPSSDIISNTPWIQETIIWYGLFGRAFVGFLRMLVVPIVLVSMIRVILNLHASLDIKSLIQRSLFWLLFTTAIATVIGIVLSLLANLGETLEVVRSTTSAREVSNIVDVFIGLIPVNSVVAMATDNIVAVVIFASMIGSSARFMRSKEKYQKNMDLFANFIEASYNIIMSMAMTVIKFMPYGVIALMARTLVSYGLLALQDALSFIMIVYIASFIMLVVYFIIILVHGLNPITFFKKCLSAWLMAFSSRSSVGSLPMTISTLEKRLGVHHSTANFVASLGSTAGMNGCAGYFPAMVAVLVGTAVGVPMNMEFFIMVVVVAVLGSLGIAGIPGSATMAASIMLSGIGLSEHFGLLAIVLAIDPIIDMARTMINVAGAMVSAVVVDKQLGTLDEKIYNNLSVNIVEK
ncbi:MAG: cation:dicarboxylate symporter family transporter [Brevinema sp.]